MGTALGCRLALAADDGSFLPRPLLPALYLGLMVDYSLSRVCGVGQTSAPHFQG